MATNVVAPPYSSASASTGPVRTSRYRPAREAAPMTNPGLPEQVPQQKPHEAPLPDASHVHKNISRSMSRYHRSAPAARHPVQQAASLPGGGRENVPPTTTSPPALRGRTGANAVQAPNTSLVPLPHNERIPETRQAAGYTGPGIGSGSPGSPDFLNRTADGNRIGNRNRTGNREREQQPDASILAANTGQTRSSPAEGAGRSEGQALLANERARHERIKAQQRLEREARAKAFEAERRANVTEEDWGRQRQNVHEAEQQESELERRNKDQQRPRRAQKDERTSHARALERDRQRAAEDEESRRKHAEAVLPQKNGPGSRRLSSSESVTSPGTSRRFAGLFRRKKDDSASPTSATEQPKWEFPTIKPGGGGIVPMADAPKSGFADAERRVKVNYRKTERSMVIDPSTSALGLIRSMETMIGQFNAREAVIFEIYKAHGVRRPLRMYEQVRTVMNSWEKDEQNHLVIEDADPESFDELLQMSAPRSPPPHVVEGWLNHTNKPEARLGKKWEARWVTLRPDGQITMAKNEQGKDAINLCHLSDFDIYEPISQTDRKRKTSRKLGFAIKSQEKSVMFLDKSSYIHYFIAPDREEYLRFFHAIQDWRSYYLFNTMGQGKANKAAQPTVGAHETVHQRHESDDSHFKIGEFRGLDLDFKNVGQQAAISRQPSVQKRLSVRADEDKPLGMLGSWMPSAQEHSRKLHQRQIADRRDRTRAPPMAMRNGFPGNTAREEALKALDGRASSSSRQPQDAPFSSSGLLGAQYEERKNSQKKSLDTGSSELARRTSIRSTNIQRRNSIDSSSLQRNKSTRRAPDTADFGKPLIDLTPEYKEPVQFANRGKGFRPDQVATGGLINNATSQDPAIALPGNEDWRARPKLSGAGLARSTSVRSTQNGAGIARMKSTRTAPSDENGAFTGGLLAQRKSGWGDANVGHGVHSHNPANGPALDLRERSKFEDGSLVARMERENLGNPPDAPWKVY